MSSLNDADLTQSPRTIDHDRAVRAVQELLAAIGEDPHRDGLLDTPARVARMWAEVLGGTNDDPDHHLSRTFEIEHDEMVLVRDIPFTSVCEHHMLPFSGTAHIAYLPGTTGRFTGLSKLARLVEGYARRLQVQERLTSQLADAMQSMLEPVGVLVVVEAEHSCMSIRGVRKPGTKTVTTAVRGIYRTDAAARSEVMAFIQGR
ncbi:MAG: GTP cyclohydrolase I FolE [Actinomycetota bacterium]|jgi:GTP cyclohydrolase IA